MTLRTSVPDFIIAGDTHKWTLRYDNYPANQYSASFVMNGPASRSFNATVNPNGTDFDFTFSSTLSSGLLAGTYHYAVQMTSGSERYTVEGDALEVKSNLSSVASYTIFAESMVTALQTVIQNMVLNGVYAQTVTVAGRTLVLRSMQEAEDMRDHYLQELAVIKNGGTAALFTMHRLNVGRFS